MNYSYLTISLNVGDLIQIFNFPWTRKWLNICFDLQKDVENLEKLFETLDIKTEVLSDLGIVDLKKEIKKFSQDDDFVDASMSVLVLMAHGDDNSEVITANGRSINTEEIIDLFDDKNCPNLKGKPKWFIFQVSNKPFITSKRTFVNISFHF